MALDFHVLAEATPLYWKLGVLGLNWLFLLLSPMACSPVLLGFFWSRDGSLGRKKGSMQGHMQTHDSPERPWKKGLGTLDSIRYLEPLDPWTRQATR